MKLRSQKPHLAVRDPLIVLLDGFNKLHSLWLVLTYPFASIGRNLSVHHTCNLSRRHAHRIELGNSLQIKRQASIEVVAPREESGEPIITIGDNTCINRMCRISAQNRIHIERDVLFAQAALVKDHGRDGDGGRIRIGQGSYIGRNAAIVCTHGELVLGRHCVVAANSLVTTSFPPYTVVAGNPAKAVKRFDIAKNQWVKVSGSPAEAEIAGRQ